jgi:transcriptional regulator with XRE-family HTH domain
MAPKFDVHPVDHHIGQQVRRLRRLRKITQTGLARDLGVSFQQIQKYEAGINRISGSVLVAIARALKTPIASLFDGLAEDRATPAATHPPPDVHTPGRSPQTDIQADLERLPAGVRDNIIRLVRDLAKTASGEGGDG